jgi:hypothetical protein
MIYLKNWIVSFSRAKIKFQYIMSKNDDYYVSG